MRIDFPLIEPAPTAALPKTLAGFHNYHIDETIIVCGCGSSLNHLPDPHRHVTIGVNDVGRLFDPTYLMVLNNKADFKGDRFSYIENSKAKVVFSQLALRINHQNLVKIKLGRRGGVDFSDHNSLNFTRNSPYVATCLAIHMGARRIGLIGVDFTDNHFFGQTGPHPLAREIGQINAEFGRLCAAAAQLGVELVNLSQSSRLVAVPKLAIDAFLSPSNGDAGGVGDIDANGLVLPPIAPIVESVTGKAMLPPSHRVTAIVVRSAGDSFAAVRWTVESLKRGELVPRIAVIDRAAAGRGKEAELEVDWHVRVAEPDIDRARARNMGIPFCSEGLVLWIEPGLVVSQTFLADAVAEIIKRRIDYLIPWASIAVVEDPDKLNEGDRFLSSGDHDGYGGVVLAQLGFVRRIGGHVEGFSGRGADDEAMWHKAKSLGLAAVTRHHFQHLTYLPATGDGSLVSIAGEKAFCDGDRALLDHVRAPRTTVQFRREFPAPRHFPAPWGGGVAITAVTDAAKPVVEELATLFGDAVMVVAESNPPWIPVPAPEPGQSVRDAALSMACRIAALPRESGTMDAPTLGGADQFEVSVIIPHGGAHRQATLLPVLEQLQRSLVKPEIILVEVDTVCRAAAVAQGRVHRHVWAADGAFERSRSRNLGLPFARGEYILWLDHDLFLPEDFIGNALEEARSRKLDMLVPWTAVHYLTEGESRQLAAGTRPPEHFARGRGWRSADGGVGGAVLGRRQFFLNHGAYDERFRGWGAEDDAVFLRAQKLGRAAKTSRPKHPIYHLYHKNEGIRPSLARGNKQYRENQALLEQMRSCADRERYLAEFPAPSHFSCPWQGGRRVRADSRTEGVLQTLQRLYGPAIVASAAGEPADLDLSTLKLPVDALEAAREAAIRLARGAPEAGMVSGPAVPAAPRATANVPPPAQIPPGLPPCTLEVSVIIPHGGPDRQATLRPVLERLEQSRVTPEIILVELDREPRAKDLAADHAHRHVWGRDVEFQRSISRNIGIPFAHGEYILWIDNDMLLPDDFIGKALDEARTRGLDWLLPWSQVRYLTEDDTGAVIDGRKHPQDCKPFNIFSGSRGVGGVVLVRRDFVVRFGGYEEAFRGWGYEDHGIYLRASKLGRAGRTVRTDQILHHLYHQRSVGYRSLAPTQHADYGRNAQLAQRMRSCRDGTHLLDAFPAPGHFSAPWTGTRRVAADHDAQPVLAALAALYGPRIVPAVPGEPADHHLSGAAPDPFEAALSAACRIARGDPGAPSARPGLGDATAGPVTPPGRAPRAAVPSEMAAPETTIEPSALCFAALWSGMAAGMRLLDCSLDSGQLEPRITALHPRMVYERAAPDRYPGLEAFADGCFDRVMSVSSLDRLQPEVSERHASAMARVLRPGGLAVVTAVDVDRAAGHLRRAGLEPLRRCRLESGAFGLMSRRPGGEPISSARTMVLAFGRGVPGGAAPEAAQASLWREAAILGRMGHRVRLVMDGAIRPPADAAAAGVALHCLVPPSPPGAPAAFTRILEAAWETGPDYILLHDGQTTLPPMLVASMLCHLDGVSSRVGWITAGDLDETAAIFGLRNLPLVSTARPHGFRVGLFRAGVLEAPAGWTVRGGDVELSALPESTDVTGFNLAEGSMLLHSLAESRGSAGRLAGVAAG